MSTDTRKSDCKRAQTHGQIIASEHRHTDKPFQVRTDTRTSDCNTEECTNYTILNILGVTPYTQLYTDKCIPRGGSVCGRFLVTPNCMILNILGVTRYKQFGKFIPQSDCMCDHLLITPPHGQPHTVFGGYISIYTIYTEWMLLCKQFVKAEDSSHIHMQRITAFHCTVGVLAGVTEFIVTAQLVKACSHT